MGTSAICDGVIYFRTRESLIAIDEAAVVVQDAASSYEEMAALAEQPRQDSRLQEAMRYFREGGAGIPAEDVFSKVDKQFL